MLAAPRVKECFQLAAELRLSTTAFDLATAGRGSCYQREPLRTPQMSRWRYVLLGIGDDSLERGLVQVLPQVLLSGPERSSFGG